MVSRALIAGSRESRVAVVLASLDWQLDLTTHTNDKGQHYVVERLAMDVMRWMVEHVYYVSATEVVALASVPGWF